MNLPNGIFGAAIRKARLEKRLTQEKLAELINIIPTHMKQLESERRNPSVQVLYKLVQVLNISLDSLLSPQEDELQELRNQINLCLNHCDKHELSVLYATAQALIERDSPIFKPCAK